MLDRSDPIGPYRPLDHSYEPFSGFMTRATERPDRFSLSEPSPSWTPRFPGNRILLAEAGAGRVYKPTASIWDRSPTLRGYPDTPGGSSPTVVVPFLIAHKAQIDSEVGQTTSYNQLMLALLHAGRIHGSLQQYQRAGGAIDLYNLPGNPMQQLLPNQLTTPEEAIRWLVDHKPELDRLARLVDEYSYGTLMATLVYSGRASGSLQQYSRAGASLDLYYAEGNPMQQLSPGQFRTPQEAIQWLMDHKAELDRFATKVRSYPYSTLMYALIYTGKTSSNQQYQRAGGAIDLYNLPGNPMQQLSKGQLTTPEEAIRWLIDHKVELDRLARQVDEYSYGTLMGALVYSGRISGDRLGSYISIGGALQYLASKWDEVGPLIEKSHSGDSLSEEERGRFTRLDGSGPVSDGYRDMILQVGRLLIREGLIDRLLERRGRGEGGGSRGSSGPVSYRTSAPTETAPAGKVDGDDLLAPCEGAVELMGRPAEPPLLRARERPLLEKPGGI